MLETMTGNRWWHVFFGTTMMMLAVINAFAWTPSTGQRIGAWITIAVLVVGYATIGQRALRDSRFGSSFCLVLIIGSGVCVACSPNLAFVQAIAFPLLWRIIRSTRLAILSTVVLTSSRRATHATASCRPLSSKASLSSEVSPSGCGFPESPV